MALVKYGGGVAAISGKNGGTVYARNRSGAYMRNWAKPTNAATPMQTVNRVRFGNQSVAFSGLDKTDQDGWSGLANTVTRKNRFGDDYVPTGRQIFLECNNNLAANAQAELSTAPIDLTPPTISDLIEFTAESNVGVLSLVEMSITGVDASKIYVVDATPPLLPSKNNAVLLFRNIGNFAGSATATNLLTAYVNIFGNAVDIDTTIQFRVRTLKLSNGQYSPQLLVPTKVTTP